MCDSECRMKGSSGSSQDVFHQNKAKTRARYRKIFFFQAMDVSYFPLSLFLARFSQSEEWEPLLHLLAVLGFASTRLAGSKVA